MATTSNLKIKLMELIQNEEPFAIALTGEWGIGKTHFWKNFYENQHKHLNIKKYAYISLFGIDSLETLKYEIAVNSHSANQKKDYLSGVKSCFSYISKNIKFPDLNTNGFTMSISQSMINKFVGDMINDTLICIDDFERKSDKLDIKDIMGVINDLKEQKKCQVIVILHSDKLDTEFAEYKEKVFDDIFILDDNFDLLKQIILDDEIISIYEKFYDKLNIKNLRFYQKVHKIYKQLIKIDKNFSLTSKKNILKNLLLIKLIQSFPIELKYIDNQQEQKFIVDINFLLTKVDRYIRYNDEEFSQINKKIASFNQYLNGFMYFQELDEWGKCLIKYLINQEVNQEMLNQLAREDIFSEKAILNRTKYMELLYEYYSLTPKENFIERFYESAITQIHITKLFDMDFCYGVINDENHDLAKYFYEKSCEYIKKYIKESNDVIHLSEPEFYFLKKTNIFYDFLMKEITQHNKKIINQDLSEKIAGAVLDGRTGFAEYDQFLNIINKLNKKDVQKIIDYDSSKYGVTKMEYIRKIVQYHHFSQSKRDEVRGWIVDILNKKAKDNQSSNIIINSFLKKTDNLTRFDD